MERTLKLGTAYHGNRILHHVEEDMADIVRHHMDVVVHMYTHNDMDRHHNVLKDIISISEDKGLEVWVDNWGVDAGPGDKSYFTALHPEAKAVYSDGTLHPIKPCYNSPEFRSFSKQWVDYVEKAGGKTLFWDEPLLAYDASHGFTCCCPRCRKLFAERYGHPMPMELTPEVMAFRTATIVDYFTEMTNYAHSAGMVNTGCVMFDPGHGISLDSIDQLLQIPHFDNVGCDPYWNTRDPKEGMSAEEVYDFVYSRSDRALQTCKKYGKDHNIWIKSFDIRAGHEEEILVAADAIYDAGARTILTWSFRGAEPNDYRCDNPEMAWDMNDIAMLRLRQRHHEERMQAIYAKRAAK